MKHKAKALIQEAIKAGAIPSIMHGNVLFRPAPSIELGNKLYAFKSSKGGNAALINAVLQLEAQDEDNRPKATATFCGTTVDRLFPLYTEREMATGAWALERDDHKISGPIQEVMFFIGFVADQGEDSLQNFQLV